MTRLRDVRQHGGSGIRYSSSLSGKGSLLDETLIVLHQVDRGCSLDRVREMVVDHDLLGKTTLRTRRGIWENIHARYLGDGDFASLLARMIVHAPERQTKKLVLFYELCQSTPILRDTTIRCVYPRYTAGYSAISKGDIQSYFDDIVPEHPELTEWSPQTRDKVAGNILTTLRDFGMLEGTQHKRFDRMYVPLPAFVYVLYRLMENGPVTPHCLLNTDDWQLLFLDQSDIVSLLDEAAVAGHCTFRHRGDIYTLDLRYPSLEVCVEALATEV